MRCIAHGDDDGRHVQCEHADGKGVAHVRKRARGVEQAIVDKDERVHRL